MNQKMDGERADSTDSSGDKMRIELPSGVNIKDIISTFADSKLLAILDLLSKKKMTISQLGENLGLSPQNAHHSVETLVDSGLVKLRQIEVDENQVEKYYSTTVDLDCLCFMLHELKKTIRVSSEDMSKIKIGILGFAMTKNAHQQVKKLVDSGLLKLQRTEYSFVDKNHEEKYYSTTVDLDSVGFMLYELKKSIGVSLEVMNKIKIAILGFAMATINKMASIYEKMVDSEKLKISILKPSEASFEELYGLRNEDIEFKNIMEAKRLRDKNDPYIIISKTIPLWFI